MFTKLTKSAYFKSCVLLMAIAMLTMSFTTPGEVVILKAGTIIPLELVSTLNGNNVQSGQMVDFRVLNDIKVDGKTVISAGSIAKGQITRAKKNALMGSAGELTVAVKSVRAVDGTTVYLSSNILSDEGNNKLAISIVLTICCLFGFLIKGGKAEIPAGAQIEGTVISNVEINL